MEWRRDTYDNDDHTHCLLTWNTIEHGEAAYQAGPGAGLITVDSYEQHRAARPSTACSNETVTVLEAKPIAVALRFVLHGVSCTKVHSLIRTYFRHQATPGYCLNRGDICAFVSRGWTCSLPLYAGEGGVTLQAVFGKRRLQASRCTPSLAVRARLRSRHPFDH